MGDNTGIQWTHPPGFRGATWNPVVGCKHASEGCRNCFAEVMAARIANAGRARKASGEEPTEVQAAYMRAVKWDGDKALPRWSGELVPVPSTLVKPLRWTKPRCIFVNSMSDLFHPDVPDAYIAAVFGVMAATPRHRFQILTKRPERARSWFGWVRAPDGLNDPDVIRQLSTQPWPLPNVWLGTSVEDQKTADVRIPLLLACPAAIRFVSYEPAIGPVDFGVIPANFPPGFLSKGAATEDYFDSLWGLGWDPQRREHTATDFNHLDWIIVGGESGPGARPFALEWAQRTIDACREAWVEVFCKQLGAHVVSEARRIDGEWAWRAGLKHPKGGSMDEWPEHLRVREFPY